MNDGGSQGSASGTIAPVDCESEARAPAPVIDADQTPADRDAADADQTAPVIAAGRAAADADQTAADRDEADADQTAADADQTAADADQTAADRDEADAERDQVAAELDQAYADEMRFGGPSDPERDPRSISFATREATRISRLATHGARTRNARLRAASADARDAAAAARDTAARRRDVRAEAIERSIASSDLPLAEKLERLRALQAADRARGAAHRERAARDRAAAARERARLEAELHDAHLDDLTGAFRRAMGALALAHEIERAQRTDGRFVIAFVDVDGLKRVNDRAGHGAGDHVLTTLVRILRANLRAYDPIVRFGGDEFVCGMSRVDLADAERRFEQIGRSLRNDVGVGISVGLAALAAGETLDQLCARADALLVASKKDRDG